MSQSSSAERARFESLALPHMGAAFNLAYHLLGARAEAEDAVQDAFVRAFRALHQLEGDDIKPWLLTIVRNVCYRHLQERRRAGNVISLDEAIGSRAGTAAVFEIASEGRTPEQAAISNSDRKLLLTALAALPPAFREVIVLRELEDMSYREIADIIAVPIGTVMSRLSRAREELRTQVMRLMEKDDSNAM